MTSILQVVKYVFHFAVGQSLATTLVLANVYNSHYKNQYGCIFGKSNW